MRLPGANCLGTMLTFEDLENQASQVQISLEDSAVTRASVGCNMAVKSSYFWFQDLYSTAATSTTYRLEPLEFGLDISLPCRQELLLRETAT